MKLKNLLIAGALAASAVGATAANAAVIGYIPGGSLQNEFVTLNGGGPIEGLYAADLALLGGPANITFSFYGAEAWLENTFVFQGVELFAHSPVAPPTDSNTVSLVPLASTTVNGVSNGLLNFYFTTSRLGAPNAVNGSNPNTGPGALPNFFTTFYSGGFDTNVNGATSFGGTDVWLFLDDGNNGDPDDDNHDDLIVRMQVTGGRFEQVPEPASLGLLGLGLAAVGFIRRRKAS